MMQSEDGYSNTYAFRSDKKLSRELVIAISQEKNEPSWMRDFRLDALDIFYKKALPTWGPDLSELSLHAICYYLKPLEKKQSSWQDVPQDIKDTFLALGIPQAEQQFLAGVGAQLESELIYKRLKDEWKDQGVVFSDINDALHTHPDLVKKYFSTVIPAHDNMFAALNSAVWSGGSFVYVPAGVHITMPLQAYFRINTAQMGQFERTLIIAEPGSSVHYVEGCSAPLYQKSSLHSAVVEIVAHEQAQVRYTTIQNWATNVYNLVTKRAMAYRNSTVAWIDGNFGSKITMKYPSIILKEPGAKGEIISIALAGKNQQQDSGGKVIHLASNTRSTIVAKSISKDGGCATYRGLVKAIPGVSNVTSFVQCETMLLDKHSRSDTYPTIDIKGAHATVGHEASLSKISDEQLLYLASRGLTQAEAQALIVNGFLDAFVKMLPMEYAVEINRLITLEMENSLG